jgi:hypothetical protein
LYEIRGQKGELNALKSEVRDNAFAVSEVKKLKTDNSIKWRFEGNKVQFEFNSTVEDNLKQALWAFNNGKLSCAKELVNETVEKLRVRNKLIQIADSSEGGWGTVREYENNPLASDSDDESRIVRADSRAVRKKRSVQKSNVKSKPSASTTGFANHNRTMFAGGFPVQSQPYQVGPRYGSYRDFPAMPTNQGQFAPRPMFTPWRVLA